MIGSEQDLQAAIRLLQHFKIMSAEHQNEFLIPHKIAPSRCNIVDARALRGDQCPLQTSWALSALPDGFLASVFLSLREVSFHADMSQHSAAFYNMGSVIQVRLCTPNDPVPLRCATARREK